MGIYFDIHLFTSLHFEILINYEKKKQLKIGEKYHHY